MSSACKHRTITSNHCFQSLPTVRLRRESDTLVGLLVVHTLHEERCRCSEQQLLFRLNHQAYFVPVWCRLGLLLGARLLPRHARPFRACCSSSLNSVFEFDLAELGVRALLANPGSVRLAVVSVGVVDHCAAKLDGLSLFASLAFAVPSPPRTVGSDDSCKLLRSCSTVVPLHDCHASAT